MPGGTASESEVPHEAGRDNTPTTAESGSSSAAHSSVGLHSSRRRRWEVVQAWVTTVVAVLALILSLFNTIQMNKHPTVALILSNELRIRPVPMSPATEVYMQPSLVVDRKSDLTTVVKNFTLRLHRTGTASGLDPDLLWDQVGRYTLGNSSPDLSYQFVGEPTPIVVTQDQPQTPVLEFTASSRFFEVGHWQGELAAYMIDGSTLKSAFCIDIADTEMRDNSDTPTFAIYPTIFGGIPDCYH